MKEKITRIQGADKKEIVFSKLPGLPYQVKESLQVFHFVTKLC